MKRKDLLLISSAIASGLLSATTKSNNPLFSNLALVFSGISAFLATAPRMNHQSRMEDLINKKMTEKEKENFRNTLNAQSAKIPDEDVLKKSNH